ncbi:MAG: ferritin-like domain-containing protein [Gemmatimonadota bacterium]|nr:ferritin-like domain-containing protein [Gemmatimonadota bacterium]
MARQGAEREGTMIVGNVGELMSPVTRRNFVRTLLAGGTVVMLPSALTGCDDDGGGGTGPNPVTDGSTRADPHPVTGLSFDLRTDAGFFRIVDLLEQLEGFYYTEVLRSPNFNSFFRVAERELFFDLRNAEIVHREFVREALGPMRLPDVTTGNIDRSRLAHLLSSRAAIVATARNFEHTGVSGLNGASKFLQDRRNLQVTRNFATVEGRHAAALLDIPLNRGGRVADTEFADDRVVDQHGRDVKVEGGEPRGVFDRVAAIGLLIPGTLANPPISHPPTPNQGAPTPSFPPPIF